MNVFEGPKRLLRLFLKMTDIYSIFSNLPPSSRPFLETRDELGLGYDFQTVQYKLVPMIWELTADSFGLLGHPHLTILP